MNGKVRVSKQQVSRLRAFSSYWVGAVGVLVGACSLQDLDHLRNPIRTEPDGGYAGDFPVIGGGGDGGAAGDSTAQGGDAGDGASGAEGVAGSGDVAGSGGSGSGSGGSGGLGGSGGTGFGGVAGFIGIPLGDGGPDPNLIVDPGFESGVGNWVPWGNPLIIWDHSGPVAGTGAMLATARADFYYGPSYHLADVITPGATYDVSFYVRMTKPDTQVMMTSKTLCQPAGSSSVFASVVATQGQTYWRNVTAQFVAPTCAEGFQEFRVYFEAAAGEDIYIDEVRIVEVVP